MFRYTAIVLLPLLVVSALARSPRKAGSTTGDSSMQARGLISNQRTSGIYSSARDRARFFLRPEGSTLPPVVTSAAWKHSSPVGDNQNKSGNDKWHASRWTNEIFRRGSFTSNDQDEKTEISASKTNTREPSGVKHDMKRNFAENKESSDVGRNSKGSRVGKEVTHSTEKPTQRKKNAKQRQTGYDAEATATGEDKSDFDVKDENSDEDDETSYDDVEDYELDDEEYDDDDDNNSNNDNDDGNNDDDSNNDDDDDDVEYYDNEEPIAGDEEKAKDYDEKGVAKKEKIGREGAHFTEYELDADSSRGVDYDDTNAEVVSELQVTV